MSGEIEGEINLLNENLYQARDKAQRRKSATRPEKLNAPGRKST